MTDTSITSDPEDEEGLAIGESTENFGNSNFTFTALHHLVYV